MENLHSLRAAIDDFEHGRTSSDTNADIKLLQPVVQPPKGWHVLPTEIRLEGFSYINPRGRKLSARFLCDCLHGGTIKQDSAWSHYHWPLYLAAIPAFSDVTLDLFISHNALKLHAPSRYSPALLLHVMPIFAKIQELKIVINTSGIIGNGCQSSSPPD
jgi:hypothetical protein